MSPQWLLERFHDAASQRHSTEFFFFGPADLESQFVGCLLV